MRIILDAMGSDTHPHPEIQAAVQAAEFYGDEIILVGNSQELDAQLIIANPKGAPIVIVEAPEVFRGTDRLMGASLRKSKNSIGVGMDLLKSGEGDAFVTAGNTAGALAIGLARLGRIKGVKRPALSAMIPSSSGHCVVIDIGANVDSKPEYLLQFALMGSVFAKRMMGITNPRVGLLSNGEEKGKGNELVKATYPLLEASELNFIGNIEGKELYQGLVDVAVTDGFAGNVLLKSSEAVAKLLMEILRDELMSTTRTKIGALLAKPAFTAVRKKLDPAETGAVPLLGLNGLVFVAHGRSETKAMFNAIRIARQSVEADLLNSVRNEITHEISSHPSLGPA